MLNSFRRWDVPCIPVTEEQRNPRRQGHYIPSKYRKRLKVDGPISSGHLPEELPLMDGLTSAISASMARSSTDEMGLAGFHASLTTENSLPLAAVLGIGT